MLDGLTSEYKQEGTRSIFMPYIILSVRIGTRAYTLKHVTRSPYPRILPLKYTFI